MADYRSAHPWYEKALDLAGSEYVNEPAVVEYDLCREAIEQMLAAVLAGGDPQIALDAASRRCTDSLRPAQ
jgi:hypothetical protein